MNLADKPCYPSQTKVKMGESLSIIKYNGLTFRERLIIALASNPVMFQGQNGLPFVSPDMENILARGIIRQADVIIKQLESVKEVNPEAGRD